MEWWQAALIIFGAIVGISFLFMTWCLCRTASFSDEEE